MKKILIVVTNYYPLDKKFGSSFVRTRNLYYKQKDINLTILNFTAKKDYTVDDIPVISLKSYLREPSNFDLIICHAPNIRKHFMFLIKHLKRFRNIIFFFHGHEVLICNKVYPKPYPYIIKNRLCSVFLFHFKNAYDYIKLLVWRYYYPKIDFKSDFIFVSDWMKNEFFKWTKIDESKLAGHTHVIYNTLGKIFETQNYDFETDKVYDFITIRGYLDGSKYCIDLVNDLAKANPSYSFLVIGKGIFFSHYEKANNLQWINAHLDHEEIVEYLNSSRCALMPTRTDAQGLMMCEMATFGIPVITSDIPVCHEVLDDFENVAFIDNENQYTDLSPIFEKLTDNVPYPKNSKYFAANTVQKEVDLINELFQKE